MQRTRSPVALGGTLPSERVRANFHWVRLDLRGMGKRLREIVERGVLSETFLVLIWARGSG